MLAKVCSAAVNGIEAYPIEVEVNAGYGDTIIVIVLNNYSKQKAPPFSGAGRGTVCIINDTVNLRSAARC